MDALPVLSYGPAPARAPVAAAVPAPAAPAPPSDDAAQRSARAAAADAERARRRLALQAVESLLDAVTPLPALAAATAPLTGDDLLALAEERALTGRCGAPHCGGAVAARRAARPKRLPALAGVAAADPRFCGADCASTVQRLAQQLGGPADAAARAGVGGGAAAAATTPRPPRGALTPLHGLAAGTRDVPIMKATVVERAAAVAVVATPPVGGSAAAAVDGYTPRAAVASSSTPPSSTHPRLRKSVSWRDAVPGGRLLSVRRVGAASTPRGAAAELVSDASSDDDDDDDGDTPSSSSSPHPAAAGAVIEFELDGDAGDGDADDGVDARFGRLKISEPASLDAALADLDLSDADDDGGASSASSLPPSPPAIPPPDALAAALAARDAAAAADFAAWRARLAADDEEAAVAPVPPAAAAAAAAAPARRRATRSRDPTSPGTPERSVRRARGGSPVSPSGSEDEDGGDRGRDDDDGASSSSSLDVGGPTAWLDAPPPGYAGAALSCFGGAAAALDAWVTRGTRTLLTDAGAAAPPATPPAPASLTAPLARAVAPVLAALRADVPAPTVQAALADVAATFTRAPAPPLSDPQWCALALTLAKALSLARLPGLAPAFEGRDAVSRVSALLARVGLTVEAFAALLDVVLEEEEGGLV